MTSLRTHPHSFVGGILSPLMHGRPDDAKYSHGAADIENAFVETTGALQRMPGREFVGATRNHNARSRLVAFRADGTQDLQAELGFRQEFPGSSNVPGYARFHRNGATVLHSQPWSASVAYAPGDVVFSGGALYACRTSHLNQLPPTNAWETLEYVANKPFLPGDVDVGTNRITFGTPHLVEQDEPLEFTNDTAGAPITHTGGDVVFVHARVISATVLELAAVPGGAALDLTSAGTGAPRMHRRYLVGELVSQSGTVFQCVQTRPIDGSGLSIPPTSGNELYWYAMPATGEFEVPAHWFSQSELMEMGHAQNRTRLRLVGASQFIADLVFVPAGTRLEPGLTNTIGYSTFQYRQLSVAPPLAAPTGVVATATKRGDTLKIQQVSDNGGAVRVTFAQDHNLSAGLDHVYFEGTGHVSLDGKYFAFQFSSAKVIDPFDPETGAFLPTGGMGLPTAVGTGRSARLHSAASNSYVVTARDADGRESVASAIVTVSNLLEVTGAQNTITWTASAGGASYLVYKRDPASQLFGLIGETETTSYVDGSRDIPEAPNLGKTPPILDSGLITAPNDVSRPTSNAQLLDAPRSVVFFESRCLFGGTGRQRTGVWATRSNTDRDLSYSRPVQATDRIHQEIDDPGRVRHLLALGQLLVLCDTSEQRVTPINTDALTPQSFAARPQTSIGCGAAQPVRLHNAGYFVSGGGRLFAMGFQGEAGGYVASDLCERTSHLFDGRDLSQLAAQKDPLPIVWGTSTDGGLLGITVQPRQAVFAWHRHTAANGGVIESVSTGGEGREQRVYAIVRRTIGGQTKRYLERFGPMVRPAWAQASHMDCVGRQTTTLPTTIVTGAGHLEGETVQVWADGVYVGTRVVTGGGFTVTVPALTIAYGLPLPMRLHMLPVAFLVEGYASGRTKNIQKLWIRVENSGPFKVGVVRDPLTGLPHEASMVVPAEFAQLAPGTGYTGMVEFTPPRTWSLDGQLFLVADSPAPVTITSVTAEMAIAG